MLCIPQQRSSNCLVLSTSMAFFISFGSSSPTQTRFRFHPDFLKRAILKSETQDQTIVGKEMNERERDLGCGNGENYFEGEKRAEEFIYIYMERRMARKKEMSRTKGGLPLF